MSQTEFASYLNKLESSTASRIKTINSVDPSSLAVDDQEGTLIERNRNVCLLVAGDVRTFTRYLSEKPTLAGEIALMSNLDVLSSDLDSLGDLVGSLSTSSREGDTQQSLRWSQQLLGLRKELQPQQHELYGHLLSLASRIDNRVEIGTLSK